MNHRILDPRSVARVSVAAFVDGRALEQVFLAAEETRHHVKERRFAETWRSAEDVKLTLSRPIVNELIHQLGQEGSFVDVRFVVQSKADEALSYLWQTIRQRCLALSRCSWFR